MCQPPLKHCQQPGEQHDQHKVDQCNAQQRVHGFVGTVHDALRRIQQLLAANDRDQGGILQQHDELVAQSRQHRADSLRDDDDHHGGHVIQAQAAAGLHLAGVHGHQAAADDLGHIGTGVDAQRQCTHHGKVAAVGKDDHAHDEQLHHHGGAADDSGVDLTDHIEEAQHRVFVPGALLVVGHTHQRHHAAQHDAQRQCQGGDQQGGAHAADVLEPAVLQQKGLIKFEEKLLPEVQLCAAVEQLFEQFVLSSHSHPRFPFFVRIL